VSKKYKRWWLVFCDGRQVARKFETSEKSAIDAFTEDVLEEGFDTLEEWASGEGATIDDIEARLE
jgi:hypothetical protein